MALVHRQGDVNDAGGAVIGPAQDVVRDQRRLVAVDGSLVAAHPPFVPPHLTPTTTGGVSWVRINGIPVNVVGNVDTCGHARAGTSSIIDITG